MSFVLPCLNEAETLERCILAAQKCIADHGYKGEVVVADNGSDDGSQEIAERCGARVVSVAERGYGSALMSRLRGRPRRGRDHGATPTSRTTSRRARGSSRRCVRATIWSWVLGSSARSNPARCRRSSSLAREPGVERRRPAALPYFGFGFPLRDSCAAAKRVRGPPPSDHGDGIRERDGREGHGSRSSNRGGPGDPSPGRPLSPAASSDVARRLAPPAIPADAVPALDASRSGALADGGRVRDVDRHVLRAGRVSGTTPWSSAVCSFLVGYQAVGAAVAARLYALAEELGPPSSIMTRPMRGFTLERGLIGAGVVFPRRPGPDRHGGVVLDGVGLRCARSGRDASSGGNRDDVARNWRSDVLLVVRVPDVHVAASPGAGGAAARRRVGGAGLLEDRTGPTCSRPSRSARVGPCRRRRPSSAP